MLYYCNTVRWVWLHWGLSGWLTTLLQCFDTVGWVIRPVKTVGRITYTVLVQTLNHAHSINQLSSCRKARAERDPHVYLCCCCRHVSCRGCLVYCSAASQLAAVCSHYSFQRLWTVLCLRPLRTSRTGPSTPEASRRQLNCRRCRQFRPMMQSTATPHRQSLSSTTRIRAIVLLLFAAELSCNGYWNNVIQEPFHPFRTCLFNCSLYAPV